MSEPKGLGSLYNWFTILSHLQFDKCNEENWGPKGGVWVMQEFCKKKLQGMLCIPQYNKINC